MRDKNKLITKQIVLIVVAAIAVVLLIIFLPQIMIFVAFLVMAIGYIFGHDSFPK